MSDNDDNDNNPKPTPKHYRVGYRKPPTNTQFKPGVSGNPHGRPRGCRNLKNLIEKTMWSPIIIVEDGKRKSVPLMEALMLFCKRDALKNPRAAWKFLEQASRLESDSSREALPAIDVDQVKRSIRDAAANLVAAAKKKPATGGGAKL